MFVGVNTPTFIKNGEDKMKILIIIILLEIILITMLLLVNKIYSLLKNKETFEKSDDNLSQKVNNARNENTENDNYLKKKINILNSDKAKIKKNISKESEVQITLSDDSGNIFLNKNISGNYRKVEIKNLHISSETSITTKTVKVKADEIKVEFFS